ncbi:radical SAM protein [Treponema bryantii]|uniref:radical SAM protein n=1 Tax=Treponema bryantii TaxID=163 RepID=UPI002B2F6D6B|nr:anaerobic ribonucleoside-triphosphate reductase activating protein [Treponema bryantii]
MSELDLNKPAGVLVKTTCVDFPGRVAGSFFLKGCNIRCPYCYNIGLVLEDSAYDSEPLSTVAELFAHLEKRQGILSGLVISGGEPILNPYTPVIIKKARELGYKIKIDTNGTLPEKLRALVENPELRPDFIAMDIKTTPSRYATLICGDKSPFFGKSDYFEKVLCESAEIVADYPADCREWRTVLVPGLVTKDDITEMAKLLPQDASWQFAQFMNSNCLDPAYNDIYPYTDAEADEIVEYAKSLIKGSSLR